MWYVCSSTRLFNPCIVPILEQNANAFILTVYVFLHFLDEWWKNKHGMKAHRDSLYLHKSSKRGCSKNCHCDFTIQNTFSKLLGSFKWIFVLNTPNSVDTTLLLLQKERQMHSSHCSCTLFEIIAFASVWPLSNQRSKSQDCRLNWCSCLTEHLNNLRTQWGDGWNWKKCLLK